MMVNWIALAFPFIYLGVLVGALSTFSSLYRKRKSWRANSLAPWFGQHRTRDIYLSLLHIDPESGSPKVPDSVLKAALLRRAIEDVHRIVAIRNSKHALGTLLQRGSIGDDLWQRFLRAEQETEEEIRDVVNEANAFAENWGSIIFQSANEIVQNELVRKRIGNLQSQVDSEKSWWEKRRAAIQDGFMKELDDEKAAKSVKAPTRVSDDEAVLVESGGPAVAQQGQGKKKKKGHN